MNKEDIKRHLREFVGKKYVITLLVAAVIFLVVGQQSVLRDLHRWRQIKAVKQELEQTRADIEYSRRTLESLQNTDSLERYAREHYYMHADNEDVFVIEED